MLYVLVIFLVFMISIFVIYECDEYDSNDKIWFIFRTFPYCKFGDKCLYIHPNCRFDAKCTRLDCPYTHSSKRLGLMAPQVIHKSKYILIVLSINDCFLVTFFKMY